MKVLFLPQPNFWPNCSPTPTLLQEPADETSAVVSHSEINGGMNFVEAQP
jgi:hypothetical protein